VKNSVIDQCQLYFSNAQVSLSLALKFNKERYFTCSMLLRISLQKISLKERKNLL